MNDILLNLSLCANIILAGAVLYHRSALKGVRNERDGFAAMERNRDRADFIGSSS